jgi:DNA modification methylase
MQRPGEGAELVRVRPKPKVRYLVGDAMEQLRKLPDESVQVIVTSPPYYALRDYGNPPTVWRGDSECEHEWGEERTVRRTRSDNAGLVGLRGEHDRPSQVYLDKDRVGTSCGQWCQHCGAWRGCLGLEPTPSMYAEHLVWFSMEFWRVLRPDGIFFLNLGDSYASQGGKTPEQPRHWDEWEKNYIGFHETRRLASEIGLKPTDLVGIPWMVAFAMRDAGWYLRSESPVVQDWRCPSCGDSMTVVRENTDGEIIWEKPNPLPDSTPDRPTRCHEYVFQFTKSPEAVYWVNHDKARATRIKPSPDYIYIHKTRGEFRTAPDDYEPGSPEWSRINLWKGRRYFYDGFAVRETSTERPSGNVERKVATEGEYDRVNTHRGFSIPYEPDGTGRNLRSVWTFPVGSYSGAHFAVFNPELPRRCIMAGTSIHACPHCGAPWDRVLDASTYIPSKFTADVDGLVEASRPQKTSNPQSSRSLHRGDGGVYFTGRMSGWIPTCDCPDNDGSARCLVLDPFAGSGTTGVAGYNLGRDVVLIDLKKEFAEMAARRLLKEGHYSEGDLEDYR